MTKPYIETLTPYRLVEMYESEVQRLHYDPCGDGERQEFDKNDLRTEIMRRLDQLDDIRSHLEDRRFD